MRGGPPELMVVDKQAAESCEFGHTGNVSTSRMHHQFCVSDYDETHARKYRGQQQGDSSSYPSLTSAKHVLVLQTVLVALLVIVVIVVIVVVAGSVLLAAVVVVGTVVGTALVLVVVGIGVVGVVVVVVAVVVWLWW